MIETNVSPQIRMLVKLYDLGTKFEGYIPDYKKSLDEDKIPKTLRKFLTECIKRGILYPSTIIAPDDRVSIPYKINTKLIEQVLLDDPMILRLMTMATYDISIQSSLKVLVSR